MTENLFCMFWKLNVFFKYLHLCLYIAVMTYVHNPNKVVYFWGLQIVFNYWFIR